MTEVTRGRLIAHDSSGILREVGLGPRQSTLTPGLRLTTLYGAPGPIPGDAIWARISYAPGVVVPDHADPHLTQFVDIIEGEVMMTTAASEMWLRRGDSVAIEPGLVHGWKASDMGCSMTVFGFVTDQGPGG